ncbi:MAG: vanadium-dependent haloperoxidase [Bacteroidota bacterium]
MNWKYLIWIGLLFVSFSACEKVNPNFQEEASNSEYIHRSMKRLTDVIVHDIFSPPQASRIYAYASIAAYQASVANHSEYKSLDGQLTDLDNTPKPQEGQEYCFPLASAHAFLTVGKAMIFSEDKIQAFQDELYAEFKALQMPSKTYQRSIDYGQSVAEHILAWSDKDMYKETRTYPKYSIPEDPGQWRPTPPDYMDGIEPHWKKIRPFFLKSADQFPPPPPTPYDEDKNSLFYKEMMEVYTVLQEEREEKVAIAEFWDCNPYVSHHKGHVMFATKKITPGGHWINIAALTARQTNADFMKSCETYALTSVALADAFISCWDEKYRSKLVRPETVINQMVDEDWTPILQTPPFPEYTSGHSVISRAAAVALTSIYGDNFAFDDDTEKEYGLPTRSYNSFLEASDEAAVSRLYGGIHYAPACFNGVAQGEKVGEFIVGNLHLKNSQIGMSE